jgi:hypothetical protein
MMKGLNVVYQRTETDCGAAAVATLCGVPYEQAAAVVYEGRKVGVTASGRLLNAIRHFGGEPLTAKCVARGECDLTELNHDALLKCQMIIDKKRTTHWAAWDCESQTIRDPYGYWYPLLVTHFVEIEWSEG